MASSSRARIRAALAWASVGAWAWAVLVALDDRRHRRSLDSVDGASEGTCVSVVVPARNEAGRMDQALTSLEAQTGVTLDVLVVDDESVDDTYAEASLHASARIRVLRGAPLPPGWVGKSWANHQGARQATGKWLLFTDADVVHAPDAIGRAVALAESCGVSGLTVLPRLESSSWAEHVVQPAAAVLIRSFVAPGPLVRSPHVPISIAAGGFILVRRVVYDEVGGHEGIRNRLVDDKALAERLKRHGHPLTLADGTTHVRVRMYRGPRELWRGWRKNTSVGLAEGSPALAVAAATAGALVAIAPYVALARGPRRLGALAVGLQLAVRQDVEHAAPTPLPYRLTLPLGCCFLSLTSVVSSVDRLRGRVVWRGRSYATDGERSLRRVPPGD